VNEEMGSDENMHIHDYGNVEVYERDEVVRRAKERIGEHKFNMFTNRSSHLAKWCSNKGRQCDGKLIKEKTNGLQNTTRKTKD
jgi:hypothetical protein